jgi:hypothetical protein
MFDTLNSNTYKFFFNEWPSNGQLDYLDRPGIDDNEHSECTANLIEYVYHIPRGTFVDFEYNNTKHSRTSFCRVVLNNEVVEEEVMSDIYTQKIPMYNDCTINILTNF